MPSNDINDVLTGANVLGDVAVRFSKESGGLIKSKDLCHIEGKHHFFMTSKFLNHFQEVCHKSQKSVSNNLTNVITFLNSAVSVRRYT